MRKINVNFLFPLLMMTIVIIALSQQMFNVAPLGKLLNPFTGAVWNGEREDSGEVVATLQNAGISNPVSIYFDDRQVPHIYAQNSTDMYFAQGYVTAQLRLWQMDFISYLAAGRLSEILGAKFLDYDRNQRRVGMLDAAIRTARILESDPETAAALNAYTNGVNAYIRQLDDKRIPLEYKIMDYTPEPWSNLKTVLIMKHMANTMSGYEEDLSMSKMMLALGEEKFNKLYPAFPVHFTPVMKETSTVVNPGLAYTSKPDYLDYAFLSSSTVITPSTYNPRLGSNSWAVSGKKTKSGFPILCNDPHLNLTLPAIWLEMQLSCPGQNVYGVSIPGTPAVIVGFNENIAWGITNGADDVKDWYKLKISPDNKKYELDGKWVDMTYAVTEIKRKNQSSFYDTIYSTVHGPVVYDKSFEGQQPGLKNFALRWELQKPSNEILAFIQLNKAKNYQEYKAAISHYSCPIQNFTFACKDNTIAINHQGSLAVKWPGEGRFILDGSNSRHIYTENIPTDSMPSELNPVAGYVLSANQHPTGLSYSNYYNGYFSENRANRIKQLLDTVNDFDIKKMEAAQLDNTNAFAVDVLPLLIEKTDQTKLNAAESKAMAALRTWKGAYNADDSNALLYEWWWKNIKYYTWDELRELPFYTIVPNDEVLMKLIRESPDDECFDKQGTTKKENATDIITAALQAAIARYDTLKQQEDVRWGNLNKVNIMHISNMPAFSRMNLHTAGNPEAVNATSSNWGPSWRMIVELGDRPRAFGIYAGGQSGNVGSPYYDNFLNDWSQGHYYPLNFYISAKEAQQKSKKTLILK